MHLDCREEGSINRNASRDESGETGDESVETRDDSIEAGEKHNDHVVMHNKPRIFSFVSKFKMLPPLWSTA